MVVVLAPRKDQLPMERVPLYLTLPCVYQQTSAGDITNGVVFSRRNLANKVLQRDDELCFFCSRLHARNYQIASRSVNSLYSLVWTTVLMCCERVCFFFLENLTCALLTLGMPLVQDHGRSQHWSIVKQRQNIDSVTKESELKICNLPTSSTR
jgi:hypothetical protein